ncbi:myosin-binding protein C, cardiac-type-like [Strongylocentrotus purpuratus]|uniref:Fibronectin type-III domain-containing protein n=1 Tax=Strongylocentrotus purpuratus TaxID=7668 RepID=A0A7M7PCT6_STRPU|nr:myosin-binding protein C, cardiac-type-like [Strongylocentrotus purpuratus]
MCENKIYQCVGLISSLILCSVAIHSVVHIYMPWNKKGNNNPKTAMPHLSSPPRVKNVTTSTIEIEWEGAYHGDGPVCGFIVEIKPHGSMSWTRVGFVSFDEDENDFEYTIERLEADALYDISVLILNCSGGAGERGPEISQSTEDIALPHLSSPPRVKNVTTSTIEIEWKGYYDGDGPVCGFIVELMPPASESWTRVGFVPFDEDEYDFEYTIERLDAGALYGINVIILHCSGGEGERGREISQSTEDHEPTSLSTSTTPPCRAGCIIALPALSSIVFLQLVILICRCVI